MSTTMADWSWLPEEGGLRVDGASTMARLEAPILFSAVWAMIWVQVRARRASSTRFARGSKATSSLRRAIRAWSGSSMVASQSR